uniref:Uncharacterized protein n=2 Tax=Parascaris TaxID=6254 RepID=A0A915C0P4_PARUN
LVIVVATRMSGEIPPTEAAKAMKSVEGASESTLGEGTGKVDEKIHTVDSMKIEFKAEKEEECEELKEVTATDRTPTNSEHEIVTAEGFDNDVHEYDADPLSTWSQSSGSISYDSGWSLRSIINNLTFNAKRMDVQPVLPLVQAERKQVVSGMTPSLITLDEYMFAQLNNALRLRAKLGDMRTHIAINDNKSSSERRGIITKLFDDSLRQYFASTGKWKRQICVQMECGGNTSPSLTVTCAPGLREQRYYNDIEAYEVIDNAHSQMTNKHEPRTATVTAEKRSSKGDTASLADPLLCSFSRCSITDHVRRMRRGRSSLRDSNSTVSSE